MQQMFQPNCSAEEYHDQGKSYPFPTLETELCPMCKRDYLRKHGFYRRYLITEDFEGYLEIRRFICPECKRTVSLLPSFAHPGRTYGTEYILNVLYRYYVSTSVMASIRIFNLKVIATCSRQLLRWYRIRIEENLNALIMEITEIFNLRSPPVMESKDKKRRVRQFLEFMRTDIPNTSLKIFKRSSITYLTPLS